MRTFSITMGGLINLHIVYTFLLCPTSGCDGSTLNLLLGFGLAPELVQVGLLRGCSFCSFRHIEESTWERVNNEGLGLNRRIGHLGSTGESYNEEYAPGRET